MSCLLLPADRSAQDRFRTRAHKRLIGILGMDGFHGSRHAWRTDPVGDGASRPGRPWSRAVRGLLQERARGHIATPCGFVFALQPAPEEGRRQLLPLAVPPGVLDPLARRVCLAQQRERGITQVIGNDAR
jgi:hypothetical protein